MCFVSWKGKKWEFWAASFSPPLRDKRTTLRGRVPTVSMDASVKRGNEMYLVTVKVSRKRMIVYSTPLAGTLTSIYDVFYRLNCTPLPVVFFQEEIEKHIKIYLSDLVLKRGK